jgi:hypothetical protein
MGGDKESAHFSVDKPAISLFFLLLLLFLQQSNEALCVRR